MYVHSPKQNAATRIRPSINLSQVKECSDRPTHHRLLSRRLAATFAAILAVLTIPFPAYSDTRPPSDDPIPLELAAMGKRGEIIAKVREQTFAILESENACSAWFREADPQSAEVFSTLHYEIEQHELSYVFHRKDGSGGGSFKHPWVASTIQDGGRDSVIRLNAGGAFFNATSQIMDIDYRTTIQWPAGLRRIGVSSFWGKTDEAQITTLLHELGHVVGRLPRDDDSWDGRSSRNTEEVLRHCKHEIAHQRK
jgi:hypothetical protein